MTPNPMRLFRMDPDLRLAIGEELRKVYDDTDYPRPSVDDVIDGALSVVAEDTLERAEDQAACNKVDNCTATSIALHALAEWLSPPGAGEHQ